MRFLKKISLHIQIWPHLSQKRKISGEIFFFWLKCSTIEKMRPGSISPSQLLLTEFLPNFWTHVFTGFNFYGPKILQTPNCLDKKLSGSNFFYLEFLWTQNFVDANFLQNQKCFDPKLFQYKKFQTKNCFGPKSFLDHEF